MLGASRLVAQGDAAYRALLDRYASGEWREAAAALAAWPEARARTSADPQSYQDYLRTAIMLHTEAAFGMAEGEPASFHLDLARVFLRRITSSATFDPAARDFAARWHSLIAMLYCTRRDEYRARIEINRGLTLDRNHGYTNLVATALLEFQAPGGNRALFLAAQRYRTIISTHPDFFEARLRLGWVLLVNDSPQNAKEQLEIVAERANDADVLYLARMFLARVHERADRPAEAEREYEAARAVVPHQSALIALIRIAALRGQGERVRSLTAEISAMPALGREDPWSSYNVCVTGSGLLQGLRADARRP